MSAPRKPHERHVRRYDCPACQFAYECGAQAWECDACGTSADLRAGADQMLLFDADGEARLPA